MQTLLPPATATASTRFTGLPFFFFFYLYFYSSFFLPFFFFYFSLLLFPFSLALPYKLSELFSDKGFIDNEDKQIF